MPVSINVTFAPDESVVPDFLVWAREIYMPRVRMTAGCSDVRLLRIVPGDDDGVQTAFAIQFTSSTPSIASEWLVSELPIVLSRFFETHMPQSMPYFPTLMEILDGE